MTYYDCTREISRGRQIAPLAELSKEQTISTGHTWSSMPCDLVVFVVVYTLDNVYFTVLQQSQRELSRQLAYVPMAKCHLPRS